MDCRYLMVCLALIASFPSTLKSQNEAQQEILNLYVDFLSESVHGLTVAQIMFVNYNQELNKHVDLESFKLNTHLNNEEFEVSLFDDPIVSSNGQKVTALESARLAKQRSNVFPANTSRSLTDLLAQIVGILEKVNKLRFEIEQFISTQDLEVRENIYKVYELLEKGESYFNEYAVKHDKLARRLRQELKYEYRPVDFIFYEIHSATSSLLFDLRKEDYTKVRSYLQRMEGALNNFSSQNLLTSSKDKLTSIDMANQITEMISFIRSNLDSKVLPERYDQYGKNYYLHNHILLNLVNSISPGYISKMNALLKVNHKTFLKYDDKPLIYKVIYPQKMDELESVATKGAINSDAYPLDLKLKLEAPIEEIDPFLELEFFDPDLIDRDSITVHFNEKMILENFQMGRNAEKIRIDIKDIQDYKVKITANNHGIIYPNTVGFKFRFNGKGKKKYLEKKLDSNQSFELDLSKYIST